MASGKGSLLFGCAAAALALMLLSTGTSYAYSVLTHEEIVDLVWTSEIRPLLLNRFPDLTEDQFKEAHAYAYGGSVHDVDPRAATSPAELYADNRQDLGFAGLNFWDYARRSITWDSLADDSGTTYFQTNPMEKTWARLPESPFERHQVGTCQEGR